MVWAVCVYLEGGGFERFVCVCVCVLQTGHFFPGCMRFSGRERSMLHNVSSFWQFDPFTSDS